MTILYSNIKSYENSNCHRYKMNVVTLSDMRGSMPPLLTITHTTSLRL